jgi:uroporphyrinogen-III decarboxylase
MASTIDTIMADKKEEEKYSHLKKYEKHAKIAEDMVAMTDRTHRKAFHAYESAFVSDKGRGIDYELAKDEKKREEGLKKMMDVYLKKAKEVLKSNAADKFEEALLMNAYAGTTEEQIKRIAAAEKENFDFDKFNKAYKPKFMERIKEVLDGAAQSHLNEKHIDDIVKYTGIDKLGVDSSRLRLPEAINYFDTYRKHGAVSPKFIREEHKKKKEEKKKPEETEENLAA